MGFGCFSVYCHPLVGETGFPLRSPPGRGAAVLGGEGGWPCCCWDGCCFLGKEDAL